VESSIKIYYDMEFSFGGIEGKSVRNAIEKVCSTIKNGACYYIRTDIKEFFRYIPRERVLSKIAEEIKDTDFNILLKAATNIELKNLQTLKDAELFPIHDIGVAQGCCLSPLIGNILLHEFDEKMNERGIACLRYIDDFIMLGSDLSHLQSAFKNAKRFLKQEYDLDVYDPHQDRVKAEMGHVSRGFDFLGCNIVPGFITPSLKSRKKLIERIESTLQKSMALMNKPDILYLQKIAVAQTIYDVDNILRGWGNQYSFCNNPQVMVHLDSEVDKLLSLYLENYSKINRAMQGKDFKIKKRQLIGVHCLVNSKPNPIIGKSC
jgi:RNA-directed DNA polymerase